MELHTRDGLQWQTFDLLSDIKGLTHATLARHGGTSQGPFTSLNLGLRLGDDPACVRSNLERVKNTFELTNLKWVAQTHSKDVCLVESGTITDHMPYDGMVSKDVKVALLITHADCQAAIFYDPIHQAIGNTHSGWRGSVKNIFAQTIDTMKYHFGSNPEDILVCISPSLGPQAAEFIHYRDELPEHFWEFQVKPNYFDFWAISEMQLKNCGVLAHHIEIARQCTFSNTNDLFSYRRKPVKGTKGDHGALGTFIMLNK